MINPREFQLEYQCEWIPSPPCAVQDQQGRHCDGIAKHLHKAEGGGEFMLCDACEQNYQERRAVDRRAAVLRRRRDARNWRRYVETL